MNTNTQIRTEPVEETSLSGLLNRIDQLAKEAKQLERETLAIIATWNQQPTLNR